MIEGFEGSRIRGFKGSSEMLKNYKELKVWKKSYHLCLEIYKITKAFSKSEGYGLTSQFRISNLFPLVTPVPTASGRVPGCGFRNEDWDLGIGNRKQAIGNRKG